MALGAARHEQRLLELISRMLLITPAQRPKSGKVLDQMRLIAIDALSKMIEILLAQGSESRSSIEAYIESKRFNSWAWAFEAFSEPQFLQPKHETSTNFPSVEFEQMVRTLENIKDLVAVGGELEGQRDGWQTLRSLNSSLLSTLPHHFRSQPHKYLQIGLLQTQDSNLLEATREAMQTPSGGEMIGVLAAVKNMTMRAERRLLTDGVKLRIPLDDVAIKADVGHHSLATLSPSSGTPRNVLVEWLKYDSKWSSEYVGEKLFSRIESVTEILSLPSLNELPAVLQSCGFFYDPGKRAFGQVYNVPSWCRSDTKAFSLKDILRNHRLICFPALEDRLKLAHILVSVILFLHQISWLHKALNASNIIFFPPEGSPPDKWIRNPFIVGFMHSRKNEENPFTQGPQEGREFQDYQHPEYLDYENAVYMPKYDYYGLGILLLEIGIWDSLSSIVASQSFQGIGHGMFRRRLLEKRMPQATTGDGFHLCGCYTRLS